MIATLKRALLAALLAPATSAGAFDLVLPVDCTLGDSCFIQHLPDHDPGPGAGDFACGGLTYDGHDGTDFALPSLAQMEAGVTVLAAAPGTVRGIRDGMADIAVSAPGAPDVTGRECGNGVVISHQDGWETQYCHLKRGSLQVKPGDQVAAGAPLGQIGLSGLSEFPHLHLSLRRAGAEIDPFAPDPQTTCGQDQAGLWQSAPPMQPGGIITMGFAPAIPSFEAIKQGQVDVPQAASDAFVLWSYLFGTRAGDRLVLRLNGPEGVLLQDTLTLERAQAQSFRAIGRKRRGADWPPGIYAGEAELWRGEAKIDQSRAEIALP